MSRGSPPYDLAVLAADKDTEMAIRGILSRPKSLGIRSVCANYIVPAQHDPGCVHRASSLLRPFLDSHAHALVIFDRQGSGREDLSRESLEESVELQLAQNGWADRSAAVVIDPELEVWVWSDSPHVEVELGWAQRDPTLRQWLRAEGLLAEDSAKPRRPKEAVQRALRTASRPRSSALYRRLAANVSLRRCRDAAFEKLKTALMTWFGGS